MTEHQGRAIRLPSKFEALIPITVLLVIMISNYVLDWGQDPHIPVLIAATVAVCIGYRCGHDFPNMFAGAIDAVSQSLESIIVIFITGCLIGAFEWSGTIPSVVYYGLKLVSPTMFLPLACILCVAVAVALGSAWAVTATLGIAFMTIGTTMGFNPGLVAGMIISGAYCGDKLSVLSDSTHLAAGSAQTGLFDHVKAMMTTTLPCLAIAIVIYSIFSINGDVNYDPEMANGLSQAIVDNYDYMSPVLLLPVFTIVVVAYLKVHVVPSIIIITIVGCVFAVIFQGASFADCLTMAHYGYSAETGNALCDALLNHGGMDSMLKTGCLAIMAVGFGGILQKVGVVEALLGNMIKNVKTPFQLVTVTILTSIFCIVTMCDQYLGLIIPASMYKDKFDSLGLSRNMLSRTLEDGGTLWSPLIPWSSCGAYHSSVLGVSTFEYIPYAFMNLINPIYAIVSASIGANILYADGTYTNFIGKLKKGNVADAPKEAQQKATEALAELKNKS